MVLGVAWLRLVTVSARRGGVQENAHLPWVNSPCQRPIYFEDRHYNWVLALILGSAREVGGHPSRDRLSAFAAWRHQIAFFCFFSCFFFVSCVGGPNSNAAPFLDFVLRQILLGLLAVALATSDHMAATYCTYFILLAIIVIQLYSCDFFF